MLLIAKSPYISGLIGEDGEVTHAVKILNYIWMKVDRVKTKLFVTRQANLDRSSYFHDSRIEWIEMD